MKELQYLNKYFYKYKYHFIGGILIAIVARIFALYTPKLVGNSMSVVEDFIKGNIEQSAANSVFLKNLLLIVGATIVAGFFLFLTRQTLIVVSRHIEFDLKNEIFTHYESLSQSFFKQNRTGDLMSRISSDVDKVRQYIGPSIMYGISTTITFIVVITQMYIISPRLTLYTLIPLPLLSYSIFKLSNEINKKSTAYQRNLSSLATFTQEMFSGIRVIKAHHLEKNIQGDFQELSKDSKVKNMKLAKLNAMFGPLMIFLIGLSSLIVIFTGGMMYIDGKITHIGVIAEFILYVNMLIWPVASLGWISSMVQEAEASQKRINEFLKTVPDIQNKSDEPIEIQGNIEFKNVSFTYDDTNIQALKNVSFSVKSGETIAIFGKTGSGKSTILSLISRLYDVKEGQILIDGIPVDQIHLESLRKNMAVVPQDAFLFSDTIKNNIRFGKQEALDEEIIEAARLAAVHDNIAGFTKGYETVLGERGISLSGGQKQRVSIARALLKDAKILLLDDCLSAVDTETEEIILNNLGKVITNKTTFIVSHRVSAARNADKIIVLDEGKIIEQGSHSELLNQNGYYKELYEMQLSEKELL
ncbi:MAG: ABC transporter ATP-binding protein [Flavobacteriaceae bacterium]